MRIVAIGILVIAIAGCSGGSGLAIDPDDLDELASLFPAGSAEPTGDFVEPAGTPYNGPAPGSWTGTITVRAAVDFSKEEPGHSDLDPNNTYYETWVTTEQIQTDVTDTYAITAADDDDLSYGIRSVELEGGANNAGTTLQRSVTNWDKQNSGCTWDEENGDETTGSWTSTGTASGELSFLEDGTYSIQIYPDTSGPNGESAEEPDIPNRNWLDYSNISANCEVNYPEYDNTNPGFPIIHWASDHLSDYDVNGESPQLEGQLDPTNPGSVVQGSGAWRFDYPEGMTLSVEWNLVHDGPIVLPHD